VQYGFALKVLCRYSSPDVAIVAGNWQDIRPAHPLNCALFLIYFSFLSFGFIIALRAFSLRQAGPSISRFFDLRVCRIDICAFFQTSIILVNDSL
jgi:hypothetical protein